MEFHMECCLPPLEIVPTGDFFCFDCSKKGSTEQLETYLQDHESKKNDKDDLSMFLDELLQKDVDEAAKREEALNGTDRKKTSPKTSSHKGIPVSELEWLHLTNPKSFIGKPVRLYSPIGNQYHSGRILDVKEGGRKGDTLCFVRFPAGNDYRKTSLHAWISLEEHSLAVATRMVIGKFSAAQVTSSATAKRSNFRGSWSHARLWSRTSRELVSVIKFLNQNLGQIRFRKRFASDEMRDSPEEPKWGLVERMGDATFAFLDVQRETKALPDFEDKDIEGANRFVRGLVQTELAAQKRVKEWNALPQRNPWHPAALRSRDEYALGPLLYRPFQLQPVQQSPLILQGLDRKYILDQVATRLGLKPSRDLAADLACELVTGSLKSCVQRINAADRSEECNKDVTINPDVKK